MVLKRSVSAVFSGISTREQNDLIYRAMQEYPEVIEGYAFINPKDAAAENEIDLCLGTYGMSAVKFHSWKHGYYPDNSGSLDRLLDKIDSYGVHVQTHVGTAPISNPYVWQNMPKSIRMSVLYSLTSGIMNSGCPR